jgi:hypothetical protein
MFRALDLWLPAYLRRPPPPKIEGVTDVLLCVCDHFEPFHETTQDKALERVRLWKREWPKLIEPFTDSDGVRPRHTFFYPTEQYDADILSELAELCRISGGETEIHLHHKEDTEESLRGKLERGKTDLARHGLLSRSEAGEICYGFIHGNWAFANSHPKGFYCGVKNEISVLSQTGCYADFTMPSAPDPTQSRMVNSIYYVADRVEGRAHDAGELAAVGKQKSWTSAAGTANDLLVVQGPLCFNWRRRKWGVMPRIENSDLTGANPPTATRMSLWMDAHVHVQGRPEWLFIKLHTHGAIPRNSGVFLGEPVRKFHQQLMEKYKNKNFRLHYVTARELVNIVHAAEAGRSGNAGEYRDYRYHSPLKK